VTSPDQETYLILFSVGGVQFAAEAFSIQRIADADWAPDIESDDEEPDDCIIDMARLLDLPSQATGRTIVIDTPRGIRGFVVDLISKEEISQHSVTPIPPLLREWMKPVTLKGFFVTDDEVIGILDFQRLADVVFSQSHSREENERNACHE
jgi:chemotaxis signal transduction protein